MTVHDTTSHETKSTVTSYPTIHAAVRAGDQQAVEYFLSTGISIDVKDDEDNTPLLLAIHKINVSLTQWLLAQGADPNVLTASGDNALAALFWIEEQEDTVDLCEGEYEQEVLQITELLLQKGLDVNTRHAFNDYTALMKVVKQGYLKLVELLLRYGADPTLTDDSGGNTLHALFARVEKYNEFIAKNRPSILELLLHTSQFNVDINAKDKHGETPLIRAVRCGSFKNIAYLLKQGANPTVSNRECYTVLELLIQAYSQSSFVSEEALPALLTALHPSNIHLSEETIRNLFEQYCKDHLEDFIEKYKQIGTTEDFLSDLLKGITSEKTTLFSKTLALLCEREFVLPGGMFSTSHIEKLEKELKTQYQKLVAIRSKPQDVNLIERLLRVFIRDCVLLNGAIQVRTVVQNNLKNAHQVWTPNSGLLLNQMESFFKLPQGERYFVDVIYDKKAQLELSKTVSIPHEIHITIANQLLESAPDISSFAILSPKTGRSAYRSN